MSVELADGRPYDQKAKIKDVYAKSAQKMQGLSDDERRAFLARDIGALYRLGAHGLILRPFTLLQQMPEPEYLRLIRE